MAACEGSGDEPATQHGPSTPSIAVALGDFESRHLTAVWRSQPVLCECEIDSAQEPPGVNCALRAVDAIGHGRDVVKPLEIAGTAWGGLANQPGVDSVMCMPQRMIATAAAVLMCCVLVGCQTVIGGVDRVINTAVSPHGGTLAGSTVGEKVMLYDVAPLRMCSQMAPGRPYLQTSTKDYFEATGQRTRSARLAFFPDGRLLVAAAVEGHLIR